MHSLLSLLGHPSPHCCVSVPHAILHVYTNLERPLQKRPHSSACGRLLPAIYDREPAVLGPVALGIRMDERALPAAEGEVVHVVPLP